MTDLALRAETAPAITTAAVSAILGRHFALYRRRPAHYQTVMLRSLREVWRGPHEHLLDIGGGTGVIAESIAELFPVGTVTSVDVEDRFCAGLSIDHRVYDGRRLPFADKSGQAATINNVVHHIPPERRVGLFRDIARVVDGPLYIKDHLSRGRLDDARLTVLDMIGNLAFAGMIRADYLTIDQWRMLADDSGYRIADMRGATYRRGPSALAFPNRLEITMRWEPR